MPAWRRDSIFGPGPRVTLDREQRARWRALLHLNRKPGRLTLAAHAVGRALVDMLGADGQLDPSHATLAALAACSLAAVKRALVQLRALGFVDWVRRLVRDGSRVEQVSNAYVLRIPEAHPARAVRFLESKKGARGTGEVDRPAAIAAIERVRRMMEAKLAKKPCEASRTCF